MAEIERDIGIPPCYDIVGQAAGRISGVGETINEVLIKLGEFGCAGKCTTCLVRKGIEKGIPIVDEVVSVVVSGVGMLKDKLVEADEEEVKKEEGTEQA